MLSGYGISATTPVAIDDAFSEPDRLCAPTIPRAAKQTVGVQTCKGFASVAASFATGSALLVFGVIRGGGVGSAASPVERRSSAQRRLSQPPTSAIEHGRSARAVSAEETGYRFQPFAKDGPPAFPVSREWPL
jgi:hypothetical protein